MNEKQYYKNHTENKFKCKNTKKNCRLPHGISKFEMKITTYWRLETFQLSHSPGNVYKQIEIQIKITFKAAYYKRERERETKTLRNDFSQI